MSTKLVKFKTDLNFYKKNLENLLDEHRITPLKFMSVVVNCVQKTPKLLECGESLIACVLTCAELGLLPTSQKGEAYILPYKTKDGMVAQFQIGYQGFVTLMYRNGVTKIWSEVIREKDAFSHEIGLNPKLEHVPFFGERGKPIGAYAVAKINGETIFKVMTKEEIEKIKDLSKAGDTKFSPWNSRTDPEKWMWQKTCIKQLAKTLPKSEKLSSALYVDNVSEIGGKARLNIEGVVEYEEEAMSLKSAIEEEKTEMRKKQKDNTSVTPELP